MVGFVFAFWAAPGQRADALRPGPGGLHAEPTQKSRGRVGVPVRAEILKGGQGGPRLRHGHFRIRFSKRLGERALWRG
jgi:hypothetical protein